MLSNIYMHSYIKHRYKDLHMHACIDTEIPEASINPAVSQH